MADSWASHWAVRKEKLMDDSMAELRDFLTAERKATSRGRQRAWSWES